eukprot:gene48823-65468_t
MQKNETSEIVSDVERNLRKDYMQQKLTIVVLGASGDLAKKKTYPSLYDLYVNGFLSDCTRIIGFARSALSDDAFREHLKPYLKDTEDNKLEQFLS